ncbi:MAG: Phosphatidylglycerol/phosphatidylinositol transfer protein [Sarea resinae]|nr:MAG: Phosphatidylglycerol/phosphatidylinositol transfer protein [Sarea resinae]
MRFSTSLLAFLFASLVASKSTVASSRETLHILDDDTDLRVPGDSPLEFCQKTTDDILEIDHVNLDPNPPQAGQVLTIEASGLLHERVEEGAYVNLQVKYGLIRLINQRADLCEQVKNVDMECPLEKGKLVVTKDVELPKEIPPGKYTVLADVYNVDNEKITCLTATVVFPRTGNGIFF